MNEQNITNIIEYFEQNPDQTIETLVSNLLNEGYPIEDIKAALDRQGISPLVIPGYKETIVYSSGSGASSKKWLMIAGIILAFIIVGVIILIAYSYLNQNVTPVQTGGVAEQTARSLKQGVSATPVASPPGTNSIATTLKEALAKEDYKITINQMIVYVDNGVLARVEKNDGKIYLDWSSAVTIMDIASKTYRIYYANAPEAKTYYSSRYVGLVPLEIIADTESNKISWRQLDSTTWESTTTPTQKITIDPQTNLVSKRVTLNPDGSLAKEENVIYEKTVVTKALLDIPADYSVAP